MTNQGAGGQGEEEPNSYSTAAATGWPTGGGG